MSGDIQRLPNIPFFFETEESKRLGTDIYEEDWKLWGPYLSERQWGTVREDYSENGDCWTNFSHDQARSRAYRWGEDGIHGFSDRLARLCFSVAMWNEADPILKERLFGLTGPQGNHGEDVKELYYYLDATPTYSYVHSLYKYPQSEYPYKALVDAAASRGPTDPEFELPDTGAFNESRYFDVDFEVAKEDAEDFFIKITVSNRGPEQKMFHLLPTFLFRNTWRWGEGSEGYTPKPRMRMVGRKNHRDRQLHMGHHTLGVVFADFSIASDGTQPEMLFTDNETNHEAAFGAEKKFPYCKDAFHRYVVNGEKEAVNPKKKGTKACAYYRLEIPAGQSISVKIRVREAEGDDSDSDYEDSKDSNASSKSMSSSMPVVGADHQLPGVDKQLLAEDASACAELAPDVEHFGPETEEIFEKRKREADEFYRSRFVAGMTPEQQMVNRQSCAGLLMSKQFYHYVVQSWLNGDPGEPSPPESRKHGRNSDWAHVISCDVISMPDKWEYPWFAAWDLAFHMIPMARLDPAFAKSQLLMILREWYMHPNGQLPAYEFAFSDTNPPVHAWACLSVYKLEAVRGYRDNLFLERAFHKLMLNFAWWVNRKDRDGRHIFAGGFLGLDNIGVFDRNKELPNGGYLDQADGTAWMAFFCMNMLEMALELALVNPAYEDLASKFFEHYVSIAHAMDRLGSTGLWDEQDGFYYDKLHIDGQDTPLRIRSMVGLIPIYASFTVEEEVLEKLPGFRARFDWFLANKPFLAGRITAKESIGGGGKGYLLCITPRDKLERVLKYMLDENEFLSPYGIRSLSKFHESNPFELSIPGHGENMSVNYVPAESNMSMFGGNSNWRGPVWFPVNYLLIEALDRYHFFFEDDLQIECPTGSGKMMNLKNVALEVSRRLQNIFLADGAGHRPCHGDLNLYKDDVYFKQLVLFYEYFHPETGRGVGASHQTGWTSLVSVLIDRIAIADNQSG